VRHLCATEGLGVLWATHLIDEAGADARVVVLHQGRVRAEGSVADLLDRAGETTLKTAFDRLIRAEGEAA
jgi:ABC-2 type transport system ATP-binding protein